MFHASLHDCRTVCCWSTSAFHMKARCVCVYRCWITESPYTIVLIIPVCASMVLNLIFLCNILRVLLLKLRAGPRVGSSRPSSTLLQVCLPSRDTPLTHRPRTLLLHYIYLHLLSEKIASINHICIYFWNLESMLSNLSERSTTSIQNKDPTVRRLLLPLLSWESSSPWKLWFLFRIRMISLQIVAMRFIHVYYIEKA
jgi:hypothetical protein